MRPDQSHRPDAGVQGQGKYNTGPTGTDRVTEGDGAAVDIDDIVIDAKHPGRVDCDVGECLVDLDQVDIFDRQPARLSAISAAIAGVLAR